MAAQNRLWGAERIRGELLKLGIHLSKRTIQKYMIKARPPRASGGQTWRTFLRNHCVGACDFVPIRDVRFRSLFAFFIIDVNTKRVVHFATTRAPNEQWTTQQLRNATPFGEAPRVLVRDRDHKFGLAFDRAAQSVGIRVVLTAPRAPRMNATCERFIGGLRRECLDHLIVLGERHLDRVLREYATFFNAARPHQGIAQRIPVPTARRQQRTGSSVVAEPVLGGLHHDYQTAA
jgi:transposase InsO family protein